MADCRRVFTLRSLSKSAMSSSMYNCILRDVMKDHSSGTYHCMITYRHAPTDGSMRTYPNTVSDRYRFRCF